MKHGFVLKKSPSDTALNVVAFTLLTVMVVLAVFPLYNVIIISLAKYSDISKNALYLIPKSFDLSTYGYILGEIKFRRSLGVTLIVTVAGTMWNMMLSTLAAYSLSKKRMPGRKLILGAIIFTMYMNGGLIPYYLLVTSLGLNNSLFSMILPVSINTFYLIIMKNYFATISPSLEESAKIDGAHDIVILLRIIIPISMPFMATFTLFYAADRWNEWWHALIFISDVKLQPLQIFLRQILIEFSNNLSSMAKSMSKSSRPVYMQSVQMASVVVATVPIMVVYPFLQKYFVKGIMVGAIKE